MLARPKALDAEVSGDEHLERVAAYNAEGHYCIFAPNHIEPTSRIRTYLSLPDDYPRLKGILEEYGIATSILLRGYRDLPIVENRLTGIVSDVRSLWFAALSRIRDAGRDASRSGGNNPRSIGGLLQTLRMTNMTIFPYGLWYPAGVQDFSVEKDIGSNTFIPRGDIDRYRTSIKEGMFSIARLAETPIVPTHIDRVDTEWKIRFGKPIEPGNSSVATAKEYIEAMHALKTVTNGSAAE